MDGIDFSVAFSQGESGTRRNVRKIRQAFDRTESLPKVGTDLNLSPTVQATETTSFYNCEIGGFFQK